MTSKTQVYRYAVIDIGTNSTLLLVADLVDQKEIQAVFDTLVITRLGEGTDRTGLLKPEAMQRTLETVMRFYGKAQVLGAQKTFLIGTSAIRDAQNAQEFKEIVFLHTGLPVKVLTGSQEAYATFHGALSSGEYQEGRSLVIDCGGGSTEVIFGSPEKIIYKESMEIGSVRLTERFLKTNPITQTDFAYLTIFLDRFFNKHLPNTYQAERILGVGGTITTLAAIAQETPDFDPLKVSGYTLSRAAIWDILEKLRQVPLENRKKIIGLPPDRADIIVAGATIYATLLNYLDFDNIIVSTRGLRFGVLVKPELCS